MKTIDLNCDMGERDDAAGIAIDLALLDMVSSANIACGGHAGDEWSMERTVVAAVQRGVAIGAHPGYPDRQSFGRASMVIDAARLEEEIGRQVERLVGIAGRHGARVVHVKPHGALYHDAMLRGEVAELVARAVKKVEPSAVLVGLTGAGALDIWRGMGFRVAAEGFADRRYLPDGSLRRRGEPDALLDEPVIAAAQALAIAEHRVLKERAETICVHSDTPHAVDIARAVRAALEGGGYSLQALR